MSASTMSLSKASEPACWTVGRSQIHDGSSVRLLSRGPQIGSAECLGM